MANDSNSNNKNLINSKDYYMGVLKLLTVRFPSFIKGAMGVITIDKKQITWGTYIEKCARKYPDNMAIKCEEAYLTYREFNEAINQYAHYFLSIGLKKSDTAVIFMENRPELLISYCAMAKIGVVASFINTNLRDKSLLHNMNLHPGNILLIGEEMLEAFQEVENDIEEVDGQKKFFVPDAGKIPLPAGMIDITEEVKSFPKENPSPPEPIYTEDTLCYIFTSGTTGGMPKAAVIQHKRAITSGIFNGTTVMNLKGKDTLYVPLPFFHSNGLLLSWPAVFPGGAALAFRRKFSAGKFWDDVRKYNATAFCYIGELCRYLMNQPEKPDDRNNPLVMGLGNGLRPDIWRPFKERFGVKKIFEIYAASESNFYFVNLLNLDCTVGTCPTPYAIVEYDVEKEEPTRGPDGFMRRVKVGESGLMLGKVTKLSPFVGYSDEEATNKKLYRDVFKKGDLWFNSGDLIRDLGYKHVQFVDRLGDTFRWKGENVSTTEVEEVANSFEQIAESTSYGVTMPGSDGRAGMVSIIAHSKLEEFDFKALAKSFQQTLPHYAVPKFIRFTNNLEKTETFKMKKFELKKEGFDPEKIKDPIFVLLPDESEYRPLTNELHKEVMSGKFRF